jgi:predicted membrane-bound dolichyl-phosphate-mannose-protein mannosyltransferase
MLKIELFEPAMCCTTGLCGPSVDEHLVRLSEDLTRLQAEDPDLTVERYAINQRPFKFRDNADVYSIVTGNGKKILPITVIAGTVVKTKSYPSYEEMKAALDEGTHES